MGWVAVCYAVDSVWGNIAVDLESKKGEEKQKELPSDHSTQKLKLLGEAKGFVFIL